ncbi:MAG: hypothetical protein ACLQGP_13665 [Isosphaeraceae bacterium]
MGGSFQIDGEFPDHPAETDGVLAGVIATGPARDEPIIGPPTGGGIGDGSHLGGNLLGLPGDGTRTERDGEAAIERVIHPEVQGQAGKQADGDGQRSRKPPARGPESLRIQLVGHRSEHLKSQFRRCAPRSHPTQPAFDVVVHSDSSTI